MRLKPDALRAEVDAHAARMSGPLWRGDDPQEDETWVEQLAVPQGRITPEELTQSVHHANAPDAGAAQATVGAAEEQRRTLAQAQEANPRSRGPSAILDYTPRAFPACRAPDGPAPTLEARLARLNLIQKQEPEADTLSSDSAVRPVLRKNAAVIDLTHRARFAIEDLESAVLKNLPAGVSPNSVRVFFNKYGERLVESVVEMVLQASDSADV